jgi:hypothetical protein
VYQNKVFLYNILSTDVTILSLVGSVDRIYFGYPDSFEKVPVIAYIEDNAPPADWADNMPYSKESQVTIDIYTAKNISTTALVDAVEQALLKNLYGITFSGDVPEPNIKLQHRVIKAVRKFTELDFA